MGYDLRGVMEATAREPTKEREGPRLLRRVGRPCRRGHLNRFRRLERFKDGGVDRRSLLFAHDAKGATGTRSRGFTGR